MATCPVCNDSTGTMNNYGRGSSVLLMHHHCAAIHFRQAVENIAGGNFPRSGSRENEDGSRNRERIYAGEVLVGKHLPPTSGAAHG